MKYPNTTPWRRVAVATLLVAAMAWVQTAQADIRDTVKKSFKVDSGGTIYIDMDHGNVEIEVGSSDEVRIEVERHADVRDDDDAEWLLERHELEMDQRGDNVTLVSRFDRDDRRWGRDRNRLRIDVVIEIPERYNIDFTTGAGNVTIQDVEGDIAGRTGAGNIEIEDVDGEVDVSTGAGNVSVEGGEGRMDVSTGAGNVELEGVIGQVRARTGAGNVIAEISRQPDGDSRLESGAGNVTVYLEDNVGVFVDAHAAMGSASTDFSLRVRGKWMSKSFEGDINGGGPELYMRSGVGNVTLRRN